MGQFRAMRTNFGSFWSGFGYYLSTTFFLITQAAAGFVLIYTVLLGFYDWVETCREVWFGRFIFFLALA